MTTRTYGTEGEALRAFNTTLPSDAEVVEAETDDSNTAMKKQDTEELTTTTTSTTTTTTKTDH